MFPYLHSPVWQIAGVTLYASELLLLAALAAGAWIVQRRARRLKMRRRDAWQLYTWMVVVGYIGGHLAKYLAYGTGAFADNLAEALGTFGGLASFGGLFGALVGALAWTLLNRIDAARAFAYVDLFAFAFPFAWIFGRLSCALVHDHVGVPTTSWLGVQFPGGVRYDLGLVELLYTVLLAGLWLVLDRAPRAPGFYLSTLMLLYGPFRHWLDRLHVATPDMLGTSPDKLFGMLAVAIGLGVVFWMRGQKSPAAGVTA
ncbi:MAG TPA: prolipoprotein diacylglyceryl transferase family protein [Candidatus Solibacter sp.]|nr:prolipoprotein diacylglyceryl transferase family protein [Candidatus Solibacter sp.]